MPGFGSGGDIRLKLEGAQNIRTMLDDLPEEVRSKIARQAGLLAMKPLRDAARENIKGYSGRMKHTGKLANMVITYADSQQKDGSVITGPARSRSKDFWFAHFIEFGVKGIGRFSGKRKSNKAVKKTKKGARLIGRVRYRADQPAMPFMKPAYESTKSQIIDTYASCLRQKIIAFWKKQAKGKD